MNTEIRALKAFHGDSIFIKTFDKEGQPFRMLIDGGPASAYDFTLRNLLFEHPSIDVYVLTHIDDDHISAFIRFLNSAQFEQVQIKKFWINCKNLIPADVVDTNIGYSHAKKLEQALLDKGIPSERFEKLITFGYTPDLPPGLRVTILSPRASDIQLLYQNWPKLVESSFDSPPVAVSASVSSQIQRGTLQELAKARFKPQKSVASDIINSCSLAFLLEGIDFSILLLGDARAEIVEESLRLLGYNENKKMAADYVKISHHGSRNNTSSSLLGLIDASKFIITTNGGAASTKHPDRETLGRLIYHEGRDHQKKIEVLFNYPLDELFESSGVFFLPSELTDGNWEYRDNVEKII